MALKHNSVVDNLHVCKVLSTTYRNEFHISYTVFQYKNIFDACGHAGPAFFGPCHTPLVNQRTIL